MKSAIANATPSSRTTRAGSGSGKPGAAETGAAMPTSTRSPPGSGSTATVSLPSVTSPGTVTSIACCSAD